MLVNEACFSGAWTPIAVEAGSGRDVIVEAASRAKEPSYNYRSASGKYVPLFIVRLCLRRRNRNLPRRNLINTRSWPSTGSGDGEGAPRLIRNL
jgi:hypothetical protein